MSAPKLAPTGPNLAAAIHASGWKAAVAITGGGSRAISTLLETPGASRSIVAAVVPYAPSALAHFLGAEPERACSAPTARAMAMSALRFVATFATDHDPDRLVGVGCTASLASDRPKRGDHRIHVAAQTSQATASLELVLAKGRRNRAEEELLASELVVRLLAAAVGAGEIAALTAALPLDAGEHIAFDRADASPAVAELARGVRRKAMIGPGSAAASAPSNADDSAIPPALVFPGAFNPPHAGHQRMAALAEQRLGKPLVWELSIANVDKPPLDFISIRDRVAALAAQDAQRPIALTHAATFREKAALFPGATFVVGADTIARIADPHYYHGDPDLRDEAIAQIAAHSCRFLVFGRQIAGQFQGLGDLDLSRPLRALCDEVPGAEFREDVSSTELRDDADASAIESSD